MEPHITYYPSSSRDYVHNSARRQGGRFNIIYNSESNQWTAQETEESTLHREYLETAEPNMELLEISEGQISAPIRPY